MTLWYLLGTVVVLAVAIAAVIGVGGTGNPVLVWIGRVLPAIAALIACIAFCMASRRARLGLLAPIYFCLPIATLSVLLLWPHLLPARHANLHTMLLTIYPLLTLFPALALWHLANGSKRRTR